MPDLVDNVGIDGLHSFEDTITTVEQVKTDWGHRIAVLGGIDVDFLCRSDQAAIRQRVRRTLDACRSSPVVMGNSKFFTVTKHITMVDGGVIPSAVMVSKVWLAKQSAADQAMIRKVPPHKGRPGSGLTRTLRRA